MAGLLYKNAIIYMDDLAVFHKSFEDQLVTLRDIFERYREENITFNLEKCFFGYSEVAYLGTLSTKMA